jgi:hypothetical protein
MRVEVRVAPLAEAERDQTLIILSEELWLPRRFRISLMLRLGIVMLWLRLWLGLMIRIGRLWLRTYLLTS